MCWNVLIQAQRLAEEAHSVGSLVMTRVSAELKMARSLVRLAEIQATLHEQRYVLGLLVWGWRCTSVSPVWKSRSVHVFTQNKKCINDIILNITLIISVLYRNYYVLNTTLIISVLYRNYFFFILFSGYFFYVLRSENLKKWRHRILSWVTHSVGLPVIAAWASCLDIDMPGNIYKVIFS